MAWELKDNVLAGEVLVHLGECVDPVARGLCLVVKVNFNKL